MATPPLSLKAVLIDQGRVLLLLNSRGEWDLPGGRPESGENHRKALQREVREETGLNVMVSNLVDEHVFEVLPGQFVQIAAYGCLLRGAAEVQLSDEHQESLWVPLDELQDGVDVAGHRLPPGYLQAIRNAAGL